MSKHTLQDSPALVEQSTDYPDRYNGKVPRRVRTIRLIKQDFPELSLNPASILPGVELDVYVNRNGAVSAILPNGVLLGLKPDEFEVIAWHERRLLPLLLFAALMTAEKNDDSDVTLVGYAVGYAVSETPMTAEVLTLEQTLECFPTEQGFRGHKTDLMEIPIETILEVVRSYKSSL